jgi:DNA helicase II / ATP-dependent DNA helicase PcrA
MTDVLQTALSKLTDIQRRAVDWTEGAILVLAGPGSGKTQVLTCRIAQLLAASPEKNFRILALTFTNKAADEMKTRVATFVPGLEERANIGTFHSFCGQVLRQHGVHLQIKPDFAIYSQDDDRKAVLEDALVEAAAHGGRYSPEDVRLLPLIDRMKSRLIEPAGAVVALGQNPDRDHIAAVYQLYEDGLRNLNALDFNSLILEVYRLATTFPAIAARYSRSHPFWMLDEFQDTNSAQYRLIRALAGNNFRNIFAVADDDQIIYQWNGASFRHIQAFRADYQAELIQLPTNYRCPPIIVEAANRLVAYNTDRTPSKQPLIAGKTELKLPASQQLQLRQFATDEEEAGGIADEIAALGMPQWGAIAVLGRTRVLLERMSEALTARNVPAVFAQRRDNFLSAELRWFVACLTQISRPLDKRNLAVLVEAFNRMTGTETAVGQIVADAETSGHSYLATWMGAVDGTANDAARALLASLTEALQATGGVRAFTDHVSKTFEDAVANKDGLSDLAEDMEAWRELTADIARHIGRNAPLDQFLQELQLRSKEPSPKPGSVTLMTVHGAKGREFDYVFLIGLAEDVMPSFQSKQKGDTSPEMEEERRNCFVAITRAKESLVLSRAERYRGWTKAPSRFLVEMGLSS